MIKTGINLNYKENLYMFQSLFKIKSYPNKCIKIKSYNFSKSTRCMNDTNLNQKKTTDTVERKSISRIPLGIISENNNIHKKNKSSELQILLGIGLSIITGGLFYFFYEKEKKRLEQKKKTEENFSVGKSRIGGNFELIDTNKKIYTSQELINDKNIFSIIYFGFTHCPDVCPDELDKLGEIIEKLKTDNIILNPIFITCDPQRDTPEVIKSYLKDFHPSIIGLTGTYEQISTTCRMYKVYFSTPKDASPNEDYLVDHSIFFYLMGPNGNFIDIIGNNVTVDDAVLKIQNHVKSYNTSVNEESDISFWKFCKNLFLRP